MSPTARPCSPRSTWPTRRRSSTPARAVRYVTVGHYPYGAGITRTAARAGDQRDQGSVHVVDLASGTGREDDPGRHGRLSHPESIAMDPKRARAYVAVTNQDLIAVIDTTS